MKTTPIIHGLAIVVLMLLQSGCTGTGGLTTYQPAATPPTEPKTVEPTPPATTDLNDREQAFKTLLTGSELVGHFTLDGADPADGEPLNEERYSITNVTKVSGNRWRIECRIRYGDKDVSVPLVLPVIWAGDTPMIGVTKMMIPGLGRYNARVLFYNNKYAGTWSGDGYGGHLFGRVERAKKP